MIDPAAELERQIFEFDDDEEYKEEYAIELSGDWLYFNLIEDVAIFTRHGLISSKDLFSAVFSVMLETGSGSVELLPVALSFYEKKVYQLKYHLELFTKEDQ